MSRRLFLTLFVTAALLCLSAVCFNSVLFRDGQFGFRDAAHHYYPLHDRLRQEWSVGRIPLWDPWENGGQPLLGNPTAAVFYPGKLLFAALPMAWASRWYVILHVALAFAGMRLLLRAWGISRTAATLGALSYSFGGPVLFLYNNVIYLIGAAWIPFGLWANQYWLRNRAPRALAALALVLALMVLGGDPQAAYLVMLVSAALHLVAAFARRQTQVTTWELAFLRLRSHRAFWPVSVLAGLLASFAVVWIPQQVVALMILGGAGLLAWRTRSNRTLWLGLLGVLTAGLLAALLAAVQIVPTAEFLGESTRGEAGARLDRYGFSLVPYRVFEFVWPGIFGSAYPTNATWRSALPPSNDPTFWVPSLYMGGLTLVLASVAAFGGDRRRRGWLVLLVAISLLGSFGLYAAPLGWQRWLTWLEGKLPLPHLPHVSSAHDDFQTGAGSPYWWLATFLPGFDLFRYPSKLLTWTALGIAGLAALGWDDLRRNPRRGAIPLSAALAICGFLTAITAAYALILIKGQPALLDAVQRLGRASTTSGPFDPASAMWWVIVSGFFAALNYASIAFLIRWRSPPRERVAGCVAVALLSCDLAITQSPWIWTVPQYVFDAEPVASAVIERAERDNPPEGPYRIHRPTHWQPFGWFRSGAGGIEKINSWERDTLQPLFGLPYDQSYVMTLGILEPERHLRQFRPWLRPVGREIAELLGVPDGEQVLYYPRRAFDIWNTRYFILPVDGLTWRDENRAYAAFLNQIEVLAPDLDQLKQTDHIKHWRVLADWQVVRNKSAFPRAWVVHEVQLIAPLDHLDPMQSDLRIRNFLYQSDPLWTEPGKPVIDLRKTAWVEASDPRQLRLRLEQPARMENEAVLVTHYDPQRVEIMAQLGARGLVVLADRDAPGWSLTVDGAKQEILRTNLGMRGALVDSGEHRIVYRYDPLSFKLGLAGTGIGMLLLAALLWVGKRIRQ
jgi:hypothetical protein